MLDPEQLTYAQWFWIVFAMVVAIMFACRCISLYYPDEPLRNEQIEAPAGGAAAPVAPIQTDPRNPGGSL